jgi:hypothetical protein
MLLGGRRREMKTNKIKKILVIGLILLFAGASVIPSINAKNIKESKLNQIDKDQVEPLFEGQSYFILLSDYADGAGQENKWAVQMRFDSGSMIVESEFDTVSLPITLDKWSEILVEIDLDADWMEIYFDGDFLLEKAWTSTPNNDGSGELNIAAVDLFANGATSVFYDDMSLEEIGGSVVWSENFDSYTNGQDLHGVGGWKGWDNDPTWTAYVSNAQSRSPENSVDIKGNADLVHEYDGYTSGQYLYTAWIYLPADVGEPPEAPTIDGPMSGDPGTSYDYKFNAVDPDGDDVKYFVDWGDDTSDVTDLNPSGTDVTVSHTWAASGKYTITAYAEDSNGNIGPSSTFQVTMPKEKTVFYLFQRILERFPNAFLVLKQLLGL